MSLKPCKECKTEISSSAMNCPHCGKKNPTGVSTSTKVVLLVALLFIGMTIVSLQNNGNTQSIAPQHSTTIDKTEPPTLQANDDAKQAAWIERCKDAVREKLKDSGSAKFRKVVFRRGYKNLPLVFGEVNAKNSMGGYSGFQRFISGGEANLTFLEEQMEPSEFAQSWKEMRGE